MALKKIKAAMPIFVTVVLMTVTYCFVFRTTIIKVMDVGFIDHKPCSDLVENCTASRMCSTCS